MSKIDLPIAELKPALVGLGKVISKRTTLPVLGMVRVDRTKDGWITLTGTDLDAYVTVRFEEPVSGEPASILVPFEDLAKTAKGCTAGEVITLDQSSNEAVVVHYPVGQQTTQIKLGSAAIEEFPTIPRVKSEAIAIKEEIRTSLQEAFECASIDPARYVINGACIDVIEKNCHHVVATDGRHLYASNSFSLPLEQSVIIPTHRFLGWKEFNADGEWQLRLEPGKQSETGSLQISSRRWRFIHRMIDGSYPNWRQVVPKEFNTTITFGEGGAASVENMIPRLPCDSKDPNKPLGLKIERGTLYLLTRKSKDEEWSHIEIADAKKEGKPLTICLNRDFLAKALRFGLTRLEITDEMSPMKFSKGGRYMIVMPVRPDNTPAPASEPAQSETVEQSSTQSQPSTERSLMPKETNNGHANGGSPTKEPASKTPMESALEQIEVIKGTHRENLRALCELTDSLKQVQREQRSSEKEVQLARSTLEKLQSVRI